jgi:hypothetical protein
MNTKFYHLHKNYSKFRHVVKYMKLYLFIDFDDLDLKLDYFYFLNLLKAFFKFYTISN